jgi:phage FluMu protein Com
MELTVIRCDCTKRPVLLDGAFSGFVRVRCPGCRRRMWLTSDGNEVRLFMSDKPPTEVDDLRSVALSCP